MEGGHLGDELGSAVFQLAGFEVHVDIEIEGDAGKAGEFFVDDARRAEKHGTGRMADGLVSHLLHAVGDKSDVNAGDILRGQGLGEKEWTIEAAIDGIVQGRLSGIGRDRPEVKDFARRAAGFEEIGNQGIVICADGGAEGVASVFGLLIGRASVDKNDVVSCSFEL
jgi:hypothetical protein